MCGLLIQIDGWSSGLSALAPAEPVSGWNAPCTGVAIATISVDATFSISISLLADRNAQSGSDDANETEKGLNVDKAFINNLCAALATENMTA